MVPLVGSRAVEPLALDDDDVRAVLVEALRSGGDFAEIYAETRRGRSLRLDDRKVEDLSSGLDRGAGVRVLRGQQSAYAYTNVLTRASLLDAAKVAAAGVSGSASVRVADLTTVQPPFTHPAARDPLAADRGVLVDIVRAAEEAARAVDGAVRQATITYADVRQEVFLANSEGHRSTEERVRTRLVAHVVAARDGVIQTGFEGPGGCVGHELFDDHPPEQVGRRAGQQAVTMLAAAFAPSGEFTVVLAPGGGGVLFHEACGHGMEADIVAKGASVYQGRQGERIGTPIFTGVDDATVPGGWGSYGFDDEGVAAQRTVLFEDGVCTDYLSDRLRAAGLGIHDSGNGRRQSYANLPIPRMSNSYVLPGQDDPAEILRSVPRGIYCKGLGGGQVDPASGDFVFGMTEAYLIENGAVTQPIRGANLVGDGPTAISRIDALGTDFETRQGICGKDGQGVPVAFGTPTLRITKITVGGTA
jgi:TldD protein